MIDAQSGRPLAGVQVSFDETFVVTDSEGKYVLSNVKQASTYELSFARSGYVRQWRSVTGDRPRDVSAALTRTGSVSGRITDPLGEPLEGIKVQVLRQMYDEWGNEGFAEGAAGRTNDRGEYRLYWITPGRYYISAGFDESDAPPPNTNEPVRSQYAISHYPGTPELATATRLQVVAGSELNGIDWTLRDSRSSEEKYQISGRVIDFRTGQGSKIEVFAVRNVAGGSDVMSSTSNTDGSFALSVPPGTYWVGATSAGVGIQTRLVVSDRDVPGIRLSMMPAVSLSGRLAFEGSSLGPGNTVGIFLQPAGYGSGLVVPPLRPQSDGSFTTPPLLPGPYRLRIEPLPPEYFIREARIGETDILGKIFEITPSMSNVLHVVVSSNSGELDGIVLNAQRQPVSKIYAVLIPDTQRERRDLYIKAITDKDGRFSVRGIPPGNYRVFAWENLEPYAYFDPMVVQQAEINATPIRIGQSSKQTIEIRSIPEH